MGSAILGLAAVTGETPFAIAKRFWNYGEPIYPNPEHQAIYNRKYQMYKTLRTIYMAEKQKLTCPDNT